MSRVPTTTKTNTITEERHGTYSWGMTLSLSGVVQGGSYTLTADLGKSSSFSGIRQITSVSLDRVSSNLDSTKTKFTYRISGKSYTVTASNITFKTSTPYQTADIRDKIVYTREREENVTTFKMKLNGTAYEKIKLNGSIVTPKA